MYIVRKFMITYKMVTSSRAYFNEDYEKCQRFIEKEKKRLKAHKGCTFEFKIEEM